MKQVEDFIRQNKAAFDDKEPSDRVWSRIQSTLFGGASLWNSVVLWRAAAVLFFGISLVLLIPKFFERQNTQVALREFQDVESYYISQISTKIEILSEVGQQDSGLNGFTHDFQQLEAMYQVLKEEMKNKPSQQVKDALVLNLLIRIDLLNKQLHKIEQDSGTDKPKEVDVSV